MLKLKNSIRWIAPMLIMALIAGYFAFSPMVSTFAAGWSGH